MTTLDIKQPLPVAMALGAGQDVNAYIANVNQIPVLTAEDEVALAVKYRDDEDIAAARQLVLCHLRDVVKVARGYLGYGLPLVDLIQEGNIGLMKAVKRYDPERGVRLVSFAVHWIKAEIYDYVLKNWRIVKVATTKAQRKLFFNLRKSKKSLGWMKDAEVKAMAENLDVEERSVREMESRLSGKDVAFDAPNDDNEDAAYAPSQFISAPNADPAELIANREISEQKSRALSAALSDLDERSKDIVSRRWLANSKPTLHDLAAEYNVSAERIRQIEKRAMDKMKDIMLSA